MLVNYKNENDVLEPRIMPQWYIKMKPLAEKARDAVKSGKVKFVTDYHEKIFFHWLDELRDWNISRQIVWGIPIPAWYQKDKVAIQENSPGEGWAKDPDTFDTWFSSGQWPFAVLGFPDSPDFKTFYPTSVMETGHDILFFWVMRMIMLGLYRTGDVPFRDIYLHGLVRDANRQKMSKSKGNVINPLDIAKRYGTDALRMALLVGNTPGQDMALAEDKIKAYKLFSNKIWNIARFVASNTESTVLDSKPKLAEHDEKNIEAFNTLIHDVTKDMEEYRLYLAAEKLYHYLWHTFADSIVEESKPILDSGAPNEKISKQWTLAYIFSNALKLLHPFMPFITEELWSLAPHKSEAPLLIAEEWPRIP